MHISATTDLNPPIENKFEVSRIILAKNCDPISLQVRNPSCHPLLRCKEKVPVEVFSKVKTPSTR